MNEQETDKEKKKNEKRILLLSFSFIGRNVEGKKETNVNK